MLELEGSCVQLIVVLEGNPDREAFVKCWASGNKHVRSAVRSFWHSTEEEELDDEVELEVAKEEYARIEAKKRLKTRR